MNENWILYKNSRKQMGRSVFTRYGVATLLPCLAAFIINLRPSLAETPHFVFLGAIVLSALYGGVGPAFFSVSVSTVLVQLLFAHSFTDLLMYGNLESLECLGLFVLISLMIVCLISALRREKISLRESEERYRILAESASDAILVIDELGEILFVNPVAEKLFGAQQGNILGQNIARLMPHSIYQPYLAAEKADNMKTAVAFHLPADKQTCAEKMLEMSLSTCSKQGRRLYTAIIRDITGLHRPNPVHLGIPA